MNQTLAAFLTEKMTQEYTERGVSIDPNLLSSVCDSVAHSLHHAAVGKHEALKELVDTYQAPSPHPTRESNQEHSPDEHTRLSDARDRRSIDKPSTTPPTS